MYEQSEDRDKSLVNNFSGLVVVGVLPECYPLYRGPYCKYTLLGIFPVLLLIILLCSFCM